MFAAMSLKLKRLLIVDSSSHDGSTPINVESIAEVEFYADHFGSYSQYDMAGTPPPLKITHDQLFDDDYSDIES